MVQINFARREVNCKLVYYGPGLSGKTTNIEKVHELMPAASRGSLTSIATEGDRTLFFDFLPLDLGEVAGMQTKFQLYTVPGQVYYNGTRKLVLQGADGVVFVADSDPSKRNENIESLANLEENLAENGLEMATLPMVLQYNKRDLPKVMTIEEMNQDLNRYKSPTTEAVAKKGEGVLGTLKAVGKLVLENLNKEYGGGKSPSSKVRVTPVASAAPVVAASNTLPSPGKTAAATATPPPVRAVAKAPPFAPASPSALDSATPDARQPDAEPPKQAPKFVPKSPSKPVRSAPATPVAKSAEPEPAGKSGMLWVVVAVLLVGAVAAAYFLFLRG